MNNDFKLCPMCGSQRIENHHNRKWLCPDCGFDLYSNVATAVGVIICDSERNVLFEIRAKDPRKGFVALPGGFVDFDETAEEAAARECREEIGVAVSKVEFVCSNPNTYAYKNIEYKTCDLFFCAELPPQFKTVNAFIQSLHPQETEVAALVSYKVQTPEDVEKIPFAFDSARKTLLKWISSR